MKHEGTNMFEIYQYGPHAYGHTWSPRYEPAVKLMHGHAASIGMAFGASLAVELGWLSGHIEGLTEQGWSISLRQAHPRGWDVYCHLRLGDGRSFT
jgi:3-dehydroquinate synthetase